MLSKGTTALDKSPCAAAVASYTQPKHEERPRGISCMAPAVLTLRRCPLQAAVKHLDDAHDQVDLVIATALRERKPVRQPDSDCSAPQQSLLTRCETFENSHRVSRGSSSLGSSEGFFGRRNLMVMFGGKGVHQHRVQSGRRDAPHLHGGAHPLRHLPQGALARSLELLHQATSRCLPGPQCLSDGRAKTCTLIGAQPVVATCLRVMAGFPTTFVLRTLSPLLGRVRSWLSSCLCPAFKFEPHAV